MLIGSDWSNGLNPLNTSDDVEGLVSPLDVLLVVNEINNSSFRDPETGKLPPAVDAMPPPFVDVNCDTYVTAIDALLVINHLNGKQLSEGMAYVTSSGEQANYSPIGCGAILREESDFVSTLTTPLTIPEDAAAVTVELGGIELDRASQGLIHDAFEISLLDPQGQPLVHGVLSGGDAFFNASEGAAQVFTSQVYVAGSQVTLSLEDVLPGTVANLVFRLVNNDTDVASAAAIRWVEFSSTFNPPEGQDAKALQEPATSVAASRLPEDAFPARPQFSGTTATPRPGAIPGRAPAIAPGAGSVDSPPGASSGSSLAPASSEGHSGSVIDSRGTEFWFGFPDNLFEGNHTPQKSLHITGDVATTGFVEIPGLIDPATTQPFRAEFVVNPGEVTAVELPSDDPSDNSNDTQTDFDVEAELVAAIQTLGVHVVALDQVTVYGISRAVNTTDAFLALPVDSLGKEYIDLGYGNTHRLTSSPIGSQFLIVATEDDTQVDIAPGEYTFSTANSDARIYRPAGQQSNVSFNGTDIGPFTATVGGPWSLEVKPPFEGYAGNYNFELVDVASAAEPVEIGEQTIVEFDDGRRAKVVSFDVTAGQQLYYDAINPSPQPNVRSILIAPSGLTRNLNLTADESSVQNQFGPFSFRESGTYYLLLEGNQDAAFNFGFRLIDLTTLPKIEFGTLYSPTFARRGQAALYQLEGQVGQQIYFDSQNGNNAVNMRVYGPGGEVILSTGTVADSVFRLPETGCYYVFLDSNSFSDGGADFRFVDLASLPLLASQTTTTTSFSGGVARLFRFSGQAGQDFKVNIESASNAFRTQYELYDPAGNRVTLTTGGGMVSGKLLLDGEYILNIRGVSVGDVGDVTFSYTLTDDPAVVKSGFNSLETLTIAAGEEATFELTAPAGTPFLIDALDTTDQDLLIDFRGPDGTRLFTGAFPANEQQDIPRAGPAQLPVSGTYTITLRGSTATAAGSYTFRVLDLTASATPIQIGDTVTSTLTDGREAFLYSFEGTVGQLLRFDGLGGSGGRLRVYDRFLQTAFSAGAFDASPTTDGLFRITREGTHYVMLIGESNTPAEIDFRILDVAGAPLLSFGERVVGTLPLGRDAVDFRIDLDAGQRIRFDSLATVSSSAQVRIEQAGGRTLYAGTPNSDTGPRSYFGVQASGEYIVSILNLQDAEASYDFRIDNLDLAPLLSFDTEQNIILNPGRETQTFRVSANAGDMLHVDNLTSTANNLNWTFFGEDSESIGGENSGRDFTATAFKDGIYYLLINGRDNSPIPVDFSISRTPAEVTPITGVNEATNLDIGIHETGIHTFDVPVGRLLYLNVLDTQFAIPPQTVTLQQGETYLLQDQRGGLFDFNPDLTGSVITSDKPIAVMGGNRCTFVPTQHFACDHLIEQLPPTNTWGREFVTVPLVTGTTVGDRFRFLAQTDGTEVTIDGQVVATLNRGQFHEQVLAEAAYVKSNGPILVAQYAHSQSFYQQTGGGDPAFLGDPFMVLIPPYEQFLSSYTVSTPAEESIPENERFDRNFINIVAPAEAIGQIEIDGVAIDASEFSAIGESGFFGAQVPIALGSYDLAGPLPFGVFVYGFGSFDSYGYTGGQALSPVATVGSVLLTPAVANPQINNSITFTARVADNSGGSIEGIRVDFDVAGVNAQRGFGFSDAQGNVQFSYIGNAQGRDVVTASVGQLLDDSIVDWRTDAAAPQITVTSPLNDSSVPAGTTLVATGFAVADFPNATIDLITVNGTPLDSVDAAGNFFVSLFVGPGDNEFEFTAIDSNNQSATQIITIPGLEPSDSEVDFTQFADVTGSFDVNYARTSYDTDRRTLLAETAVANVGQFPADAPLLVAIANISDPMVLVRDADGETPDGLPYYDFTGLVTGGTLDPQGTTGFLSAAFYNPNRTQFTYDLLFFGKLNEPPQFTSLPATNAELGREYTYQVNAFDPNGEDVSFELLEGPAAMTLDAATGLIRWTPGAGEAGVHSVEVQVADERLGVSTQRFNITSAPTPANRAPVFTSFPVGLAEVGVAYPYAPDAVDTDGDTLAFGVVAGPSGLTIDATSGVISWQPTPLQLGNHDVVVEVSDGRGGAAQQSFSVLVISPADNLAPVIVSSPPVAVKLGAMSYQTIAHDADVELLSYQLLDGPAGITIDASGLVSWTSTSGDLAAHQVIIQVVDPRGGVDVQDFMLAVFDNDDPTITSQPVVTGQVGNAYSYQVTVTDSVDDMFSFKLLDAPPGMTIDNATGLISWDVTDAAYEQERVTVAVMDGRGGFASQQFAIDVAGGQSLANNVNPFFTSTAPTVASVGTKLLYDVDARDPNGDVLAYDLPLAPDGMVIDPVTGQLGWLPRADQAGMQQVVIRAKDGTNAGIWLQSFQIIVDASNTAPVITSAPLDEATVGNPWEYRLRAQDADGDDLMFELVSPAAGMTLTALDGGDASAVLSFTPGAVGSIQVALAVKDARGGVAEQQFTLTVVETAANIAPVVHSSPRTSIAAGQPWFYLIDADDPNADPVDIALSGQPAGMTLDENLRAVSWLPTLDQLGTHSATLTFSDGRGGVTEQAFSIDVTSVNDNTAPRIVSPPSAFRATVGKPFAYDLRAADEDGDPVEWTLIDAPHGASLSLVYGTLRYTPTLDHIGLQRFVVSAKDPAGQEAMQSFSLLVSGANLAPVILSRALSEAIVDESYVYGVRAVDAENDVLVYTLTNAPTGMTIDAARGIIRWRPTLDQLGSQSATLEVTDSQGNSTSQTFSIDVTQVVRNQPPVITSRAVFKARVDAEYRYDVEAVDPEGEKITYSLVEAPSGMQIDSSTGVITWTPTAAQAGAHLVRVAAADTSGNVSVQRFGVQARANQAPVINSAAPTSVSIGGVYRYDVQATDAENDALDYQLLVAPAGMEIDARGRIRWSTAPGVEPSNPVTIQVTDAFGASVLESYTLDVTPDTTAPQVALQLSANPLALGGDTVVLVQASDDVGVVELVLTVDGVPQVLDANNSLTLRGAAAGLFALQATARDASGNESTTEVDLRVFDPADTQGPIITLTSPAPSSIITTLTDIVGTVTDDNLDFFRVDYGRADLVDVNKPTEADPDYKQLVRKNAQAVDEVLATFDPTMLHNDDYVIRILAQDLSGNVSAKTLTLGMDGQLKLGQFELDFTDLSIPVAGIPITVTRSYDTRDAGESGDFGFGWTLSVSDPNIRETLPINEFEKQGLSRAATPFRDGTRVYLTNPEGRRIAFTFRPQRQFSLFGGGSFSAYFEPDPGVYDRIDVGELQLRQVNGAFYHGFDGAPFNPNAYRLTTKDGTVYAYGQFGGLDHIIDRNSNRIDIRPNGIFSSLGPSIEFIRDPQGRISQIIDPAGSPLNYEYDRSGNLSAFVDQVSNTTKYTYLDSPEHFLDTIIDTDSHTVFAAEFDETGRLIGTTDALGKSVSQSFDVDNNLFLTTDLNGNVTQVRYDSRGNIVEEVDALGNSSFYEYDDPQNPDLETRIVDRNGNEMLFAYDDRGNLTSTTDAFGGMTQFTYDARNNLVRSVDALGRAEQFVFDELGQLVTRVNAHGELLRQEYDAVGRIVARTLADGSTTTATYDEETGYDLPVQIIHPDESTATLEINSRGLPIRIEENPGNPTLLEYDNLGRMVRITDPAGAETEYIYGTSRLVAYRERLDDDNFAQYGFEYDTRGYRTRITDARGFATEFKYDGNGNLILVRDANGNETVFEYDELDRLILKRDTFGNSELYEYDPVGNLMAVVDRTGRKREFLYDKLNRLVGESWFDENDLEVYDATWVLDSVGKVILASDSSSTIAFSYDALDQVLSVDNAGTSLQPHLILTQDFDLSGNLISVRDNNDIASIATFDERGRLTSRDWRGGVVDPIRVEYEYESGFEISTIRRISEVLDSVSSTQISYDNASRPIQIQHRDRNDGLTDAFAIEYDRKGKVISKSQSSISNVSSYTYDAAGQLTGAMHTALDDETYAYDGNGNRISSHIHGNGYVIGQGNRLISDGIHNYEYDANGRLIRQTEVQTAETVDYAYDHRGRVTRISRSSANGVLLTESLYRYDIFDRRIQEVNDGVATTVIYDRENPWVEFRECSADAIYYLSGDRPDDGLALYDSGQGTMWQLRDHLGSVVALAAADGSLANRFVYDSFGNEVSGELANSETRFGFTGREFQDHWDTYYVRARHYDPAVGRFISEDPISFSAGDTNLYRYVANAPLDFVDPTGNLGVVAKAALQASVNVLIGAGFSWGQAKVCGADGETQLRQALVGGLTGIATFGVASIAFRLGAATTAATGFSYSFGAQFGAAKAFSLPFRYFGGSGRVFFSANAALPAKPFENAVSTGIVSLSVNASVCGTEHSFGKSFTSSPSSPPPPPFVGDPPPPSFLA